MNNEGPIKNMSLENNMISLSSGAVKDSLATYKARL